MKEELKRIIKVLEDAESHFDDGDNVHSRLGFMEGTIWGVRQTLEALLRYYEDTNTQ